MFPFNSFVFTKQIVEFTLADATICYGKVGCGINFPWCGNGK